MEFKVSDKVRRIKGEAGDRLKIGDIGVIEEVFANTNSYRVVNERTGETQTWGINYVEGMSSQTYSYLPLRI